MRSTEMLLMEKWGIFRFALWDKLMIFQKSILKERYLVVWSFLYQLEGLHKL